MSKKVPLQSYCPPSCVCGGKEIKIWLHEQCLTQAYISNQGDISCAQGCGEYFIQYACFKCEQSIVEQQQQKAVSKFLLALAQAIQSVELHHLSDQQKIQFITSLNQSVVQRWSY